MRSIILPWFKNVVKKSLLWKQTKKKKKDFSTHIFPFSLCHDYAFPFSVPCSRCISAVYQARLINSHSFHLIYFYCFLFSPFLLFVWSVFIYIYTSPDLPRECFQFLLFSTSFMLRTLLAP